MSFVVLLYVAGHETTVNLIGNGMLALLRHPDELRPLARRPVARRRRRSTSCCATTARCSRPCASRCRTCATATSTVPPGSTVMTVLGAASHDPAMFDDPETLRLDRPNANRHLGFAAGVHYCLGASLAKLEATVAITSLIRRFPGLALAGEPGWRDRLTIRGVDHLPLGW